MPICSTASDQTATLVRQELELAKAELTTKGKQVGLGAGMFGGAGVFGVYAFGALTAALILALSLAVTGWLAALIVAAVYGAIAGVLALRASEGQGRHAADARADGHRRPRSQHRRPDVRQPAHGGGVGVHSMAEPTPFTHTVIIGSSNSISAPPTLTASGIPFAFASLVRRGRPQP